MAGIAVRMGAEYTYALRNIKAPIGVSEYALSKALPKELKTELPTVEEIEAELNQNVVNKKPD